MILILKLLIFDLSMGMILALLPIVYICYEGVWCYERVC